MVSIDDLVKWAREFNAPIKITRQLSGLSESKIHAANQILIESGEKGKSPIYEILSLIQNDDDSVDPFVSESRTILKAIQ